MAGLSNSSANSLALLLFQATTWANVAQNAGTSPATTLYISLHTADPGPSGTQSTSEAAYTGYARQTLIRTAAGWTVAGAVITPISTISFPACTGGSETETFLGIGLAATAGTGTTAQLLMSGSISPTIAVASGVTPQLTTSSTITLS
jgi:hypothetical protein